MAKTSLHSFWLNLREEVVSPIITVQVNANVISALAARRTNAAMIRRKRNHTLLHAVQSPGEDLYGDFGVAMSLSLQLSLSLYAVG